MFVKLEAAVTMLNREYMESFHISKEDRSSGLHSIVNFLKDYCFAQGVIFAHGRGKRKSVHQRYLELFWRFLERQLLYDLHHSCFGACNSYSKTDVDATFMHIKDDHMRNAQPKPGYNVQIGVDSEYIVAADISQDRNDAWTLVPFLKHMEKQLGFRYPSVTVDSGYESEEAYDYLKEQKQAAYINPQTNEKRKKRSFKQDISKRENMGYDEVNDTYTCHAGKTLSALYVKKQKSKNDYDFQRFLLQGKTGDSSAVFWLQHQ